MEVGVVMQGDGADISTHFLGCFLRYYDLVSNMFSNQFTQCICSELLHLQSYLGGDLR